MNTNDKRILRDACIDELKRELKMRVSVWPQSKPFNEHTGPTFKAAKHQKMYSCIESVLSVVSAMSPEQFFEFWTSPPHVEPTSQQTLF
jgi:hypothetical protein